MPRELTIKTESWPIAGQFRISRGTKTVAEVVVCSISEDGHVGRGECVPYARYGETSESVISQIETLRGAIEAEINPFDHVAAMPPGAARNALDCALWDLRAKSEDKPVHRQICANPVRPIATAVTVSLGSVQEMADKARAYANRDLIKVKLGSDDDEARIRAVTSGAPNSRIILDANEGWNPDNLHRYMMVAAERRIALIEQPLPAGQDEILSTIPHPVPICADESVHTTQELENLRGRYDAVNIKLDKTGGLSEAINMRDKAHEMGFSVMVGCMVGTSLSMAPAVLLAQTVEFVDLDGPLLLARDRPDGLDYSASTVSPPSRRLWG